jgi:hypothetical protein
VTAGAGAGKRSERRGEREQRDGARERGALAGGARWRVQVLGKDSQLKGGDDERDIEREAVGSSFYQHFSIFT